MNVTTWTRRAVGLLAVVLVTGGAGCHDPRAVEPTARRVARINRHLALAADREADGPRRVQQTAHLVGRFHREHVARLPRDLEFADKWIRHDVPRWNEPRPHRNALLLDYLDGDLERANRTIPRLFY